MNKNNITGTSALVAALLGSLSFATAAISADVFLPIEVGVPYQVEFGARVKPTCSTPLVSNASRSTA